MPYPRPTLLELKAQALQDINSAQITAPSGNTVFGVLQKSVLRVLSVVQAGFAFLHYAFLDWISLESVPFTATDEYLAGWGNLKAVAQKDATLASSTGTWTGVVGSDLPNGTPIARGDGFGYVTTADAVVGGAGTVTAPFIATVAGADGNADAGTALTLATSVPGIQSVGTAAAAITGGADQETEDDYRTRVLQAFAAPPQGGDMSDYVEWALAVPGVTRAWVAPNAAGAGSVTVYVMLDEAESAFNGFPQGSNGTATNETRGTAIATGDQLAAANAIFPLRPVTALVYVNAPTPSPVAFSIGNLGVNNTTPMQQSIAAALADMFVRLGNVGGTVNPLTGSVWPSIGPSDWYAALAAIPSLTEFTVSAPAGPIAPAAGALFTVGALTFST